MRALKQLSLKGIDIWGEVRTTLFRIEHKGRRHDIVNWGQNGFIDTPATIAITVPLPAMTGNHEVTSCKGNAVNAKLYQRSTPVSVVTLQVTMNIKLLSVMPLVTNMLL